MNNSFTTGLKKRGDFYWIDIPEEVVKSLDLKVDQMVSVSIQVHRSPEDVAKSFGMLKDDPLDYRVIKKGRK